MLVFIKVLSVSEKSFFLGQLYSSMNIFLFALHYPDLGIRGATVRYNFVYGHTTLKTPLYSFW